ncbi:hypothetical protein THAOC_34290 [Thalassiosira oceanica]|uniref:Uncharacterized protein n=1 Tax=Thalassiosira oceanica TaxID=159749 RepID=K0R2S0_THAOC|nr:hypothetical protein THAOC_34290 [Thalassiosira oceanica]|mmetsp:Transcript_26279/g.59269  ORF Transcript_26279/g.59269 Transcript_26279/m.59269 type:complete len:185 (-) Transcript_26279:1923-2477(-)|eukprot:EJK47018.1 hypothetical protein THAOC_34290 [Thalassiosira oceanica]
MVRKFDTAAAIVIMASASAADDHKFSARRRVGTSRDLVKGRGRPHHANNYKAPRRRHLRRGGEVQRSFWPFWGHLIPTLSDPDEMTESEGEEGETGVEVDLSVTHTKAESIQNMMQSDLEVLGTYEEIAFAVSASEGIEMSMSMPSVVGNEGAVEDAEVDIPEPVEVAAGVSNDVPLFFGKRRR